MRRASAWLAMLWLAGCGGSSAQPGLCDEMAAAVNGLATKSAPCMASPPALSFTVDQCRATISRCTAEDGQHIADFSACLEQLPTCSPATAAAWSASFGTCAGMLGPLAGQGC